MIRRVEPSSRIAAMIRVGVPDKEAQLLEAIDDAKLQLERAITADEEVKLEEEDWKILQGHVLQIQAVFKSEILDWEESTRARQLLLEHETSLVRTPWLLSLRKALDDMLCCTLSLGALQLECQVKSDMERAVLCGFELSDTLLLTIQQSGSSAARKMVRDEFLVKLFAEVSSMLTEMHEFTSERVPVGIRGVRQAAQSQLEVGRIEAIFERIKKANEKLQSGVRHSTVEEAAQFEKIKGHANMALEHQREAARLQAVLQDLFVEIAEPRLQPDFASPAQVNFIRHETIAMELERSNESGLFKDRTKLQMKQGNLGLENRYGAFDGSNTNLTQTAKPTHSNHQIDFDDYEELKLFSGDQAREEFFKVTREIHNTPRQPKSHRRTDNPHASPRARESFIQACSDSDILACPILIQRDDESSSPYSELSFKNYQMGSAMAMAFAKALTVSANCVLIGYVWGYDFEYLTIGLCVNWACVGCVATGCVDCVRIDLMCLQGGFRPFVGLNLSSNGLNNEAMIMILKALEDRLGHLTSLDVSRNDACSIEAFDGLSKLLSGKSKMVKLVVSHNPVGDRLCALLCPLLMNNDKLTMLELTGCKVGIRGAHHISQMMEVNKHLLELHLKFNSIRGEGVRDLAEALQANKTLTLLDVAWNSFGDAGAKLVATALESNKSLRILNLASNGIRGAGCLSLLEALRINTTLARLMLDYNPLGVMGAASLARFVTREIPKGTTDIKHAHIPEPPAAPAEGEEELPKLVMSSSDLQLRRVGSYTRIIPIMKALALQKGVQGKVCAHVSIRGCDFASGGNMTIGAELSSPGVKKMKVVEEEVLLDKTARSVQMLPPNAPQLRGLWTAKLGVSSDRALMRFFLEAALNTPHTEFENMKIDGQSFEFDEKNDQADLPTEGELRCV